MESSGMLAEFMHPVSSLDEEEFHEWYHNEHGPLRLQLPFFHTGTTYRATNGLSPAWLAFYDIENVSVLLSDPLYLALRDNHSEREVRVLDLGSHIQRKAGELISTKGSFSKDASVLLWVEISLKDLINEKELHRWFEEEHAYPLSKIPGWRRSRRYRLVDMKTNVPTNDFLAVHEYAAQNGLDDSREIRNAWSTEAKISSLLDSYTRRQVLQRCYEIGAAPRDLLRLSTADKVIDTHVPHDGYRLHYRLEGSVNDTSPVLIFCNGMNCDLHMWDAAIAPLKQRFPNFRFLRYDTRGYRFEGCDKPITFDLVASDINALLDALLIPKAHALIGVSMGGITAVAFASRYPHRLERFIACDFAISSDKASDAVWHQRVQFAKDHGMEALGVQSVERWFTAKSRDSPEWKKAIAMVAGASVEGMERSAKVLCGYDETENLRNIRLPGLYVSGAEDGMRRDLMEEFVTANATNAEFREVEGAGHLPMIENVGGFVDCVEGFLSASVVL